MRLSRCSSRVELCGRLDSIRQVVSFHFLWMSSGEGQGSPLLCELIAGERRSLADNSSSVRDREETSKNTVSPFIGTPLSTSLSKNQKRIWHRKRNGWIWHCKRNRW